MIVIAGKSYIKEFVAHRWEPIPIMREPIGKLLARVFIALLVPHVVGLMEHQMRSGDALFLMGLRLP